MEDEFNVNCQQDAGQFTASGFNPNEWLETSQKKPKYLTFAQCDLMDFGKLVEAIEAAQVDITCDYNDWFRIGSAIARQFGESGRSFFHRISQFYPRYSESECDRKFDDCLNNSDPKVNLNTVFYLAQQKNILIHQRSTQPFTAPPAPEARKGKKQKVNRLDTVARYICENYNNGLDFRSDVLSRKTQIFCEGRWRDLADRDINTIAIHISQKCGVNITPADVHTVLNSEIVPAIHPLRDWLHSLPPFDPTAGRDPIGELAAQVHVADNQALWEACFRKWLVWMVASWNYDDVVNHQVLVLIGPQGSYKTTWLERLMPPHLKPYLSKLASAQELGKDERLRLAEFGLINMDEIDAYSAQELNKLKSVITTESINERAAYGRTKEHRPRCASFCASGNNEKFLTDTTGNRRWLPFLVESIQSPFETHLDYEAIYAQALLLAANSENYVFRREDTLAFADHTEAFRAVTPEEDILFEYFKPARIGDSGAILMSTTEIHRTLIDAGRILRPMPTGKFGALLKKVGFEKKSTTGGKKGYIVVEISRDENLKAQKDAAAEILAQEALSQAHVQDADVASQQSFPNGLFDTDVPELDQQDTEDCLPF